MDLGHHPLGDLRDVMHCLGVLRSLRQDVEHWNEDEGILHYAFSADLPAKSQLTALIGEVGPGTKMSGNPTSMISLCQEGKSSPDALWRSAGTNPF
jgi:hypothetical protein